MKHLGLRVIALGNVATLLFALLDLPCQADPVFRLDEDQHIAVTGVEFDGHDRTSELQLHVFVGDSETPVLGQTRIFADSIVFEPRFALRPGIAYRAVLEMVPANETKPSRYEDTLQLPVATSESPKVELEIYPTSSELPENLLKFYLYFSQPMLRGRSYDFIQLLDQNGQVVDAPFLEIGEELWDARQTRLTLLLDPGRIKRGLKPNEQVGLPLQQNASHTLVIKSDWPSDAGAKLGKTLQKQFTVHHSDLQKPNPVHWQIDAPRAGTTDFLVVRFDESLDRAMLEHCLSLRSSAGVELDGVFEIGDLEASWSFAPSTNWPSGVCELVVSPLLEDLAGNGIAREFEVDLTRSGETDSSQEAIRIPIKID